MTFHKSASRDGVFIGAADLARLTDDLKNNSEDMARYILSTADYRRNDRLWPADWLVFVTNPLSVAYGACGTALFLHDVFGELPAAVTDWILRQPVNIGAYPPGLYLGLAGIAYSFLEIGLEEKAEELMEILYQSPLRYREPGVFLGAAGWGLVSLHCYLRTGKEIYLDQAQQAGEFLTQTAQYDGETCSWRRNEDGRLHYGFGYGSSGIALFLLYLHLLTDRADFGKCAAQALEFDLVNRVESEVGWQWKRFEDDVLLYPYWIHGSAGIGSTLIRFYNLLGIERYEALARKIADDTYVKYSFSPGLFEGLSGIGEFMLDMFQSTRDEKYRHYTFDIADTVLWFKINKPEGVAYPGQWLLRISNDYATGAAGIGLFFRRLLHPRRSHFIDLDLERVVVKKDIPLEG